MIEFVFGKFAPAERLSILRFVVFSAVMLGVRLLLAQPFWASGQTRWISFPTELSGSTLFLFKNLFVLHFGFFELPIPFPELTAWVTSLGEVILPIVIVLGLFTRLGGLALLAMSIVIELVFPAAFINLTDPMNSHALWMAYGLAIVICGPGLFSLDFLVRKFGLPQHLLSRPRRV